MSEPSNATDPAIATGHSRRGFLRDSALVAGAVMAPGLLAACASGDDEAGGPAQVSEVRIGLVLPMTGAAAAYGKSAYEAIKMVLDDVNANGGIDNLGGAELVPVLKDSQTDAQTAASQTQQLVGGDVLAILGSIQSDATAVASPIANRAKVPWICTSDGARKIVSRGFRYVFQPAAYTTGAADAAVEWLDFIGDKTGVRAERIMVMTEDAAVAVELANALEAQAKNRGFTVVDRVTYPAREPKASRTLVRRAKAENIDVVVQHAYTPANAIAVRRVFQEVGYEPLGVVTATGGHSSASYGKELGDLADNTINTSYFVPDVAAKIPRAKELNDMYKTRTGADLDHVSGTNLTAAAVVVDALQRTRSASRDALRDALEQTDLQVGDGYWIIPEGCEFDERNHNTRQVYLVSQWQDGVQRVIYPEQYATAGPNWPVRK
ncbi:MAG: ABC transporter substrate-binding protein [Micromonosporaceae bacterium]|nr:ABC transporter substrate-binding protein [Micromonosporaceae bacterium]